MSQSQSQGARVQLPIVREPSGARAGVESFEDADTCARCGGLCCSRYPGSAMPEDFGAPDLNVMRITIRAALQTDNWSIDCWEGDPRFRGEATESGDANPEDEIDWDSWFLRPATVHGRPSMRGGVVDRSWGGACVFHSAKGCAIQENRPSGCRGLKPGRYGVDGRLSACVDEHSGKRHAAIAWLPYHNLIDELIEELER